jgi:hypothetical protein
VKGSTSPNLPADKGPAGTGPINPTELAFDIDGVVANTMRLFLDIVRDRFGINHIRIEDITTYRLEDCLDLDPEVISTAIQCLLQGDYSQELHPQPGSRQVLRRMAGWVPRLLFVTARPEREVITAWLLELLNLPQAAIEVAATGSFEAKIDVLNAAGKQFFVEDRLETCFLLAAAGLTPIVYRQPWNRQPHPFQEVGDWDEIAALLHFTPGP